MPTYRTLSKVTIKDFEGQVPEGKAFYAWNTREDGTGIMYHPGKIITITEDMHLYPVFVDAPGEVDG